MKRATTSSYFYRLFRVAVPVLLCLPLGAGAQRFLGDYDSTLFVRDTLRPLLARLENLNFSGYIQPQFQWAEREGAATFEGGNFAEHSNSRFLLRRARVKIDYQVPRAGKPLPLALFTFQLDVTERGSIVRDMFARVYFPAGQSLSATFGLFARPFGFEPNLSSAFRESPERAHVSQLLMPGERDLGLMISWEPVSRRAGAPALKWDVALLNGPGVNSSTDFDSYKDLASRLTLKPYRLWRTLTLSAGLSLLYGGWRQDTRYRWDMQKGGQFAIDSALDNEGGKAPRRYYGADGQLAWQGPLGKTELRAEYWQGTQPGTAASTLNPATQPQGPTYLRPFNAGIFYFLQQLGSPSWELGVKYDWYDPNRFAGGSSIGAPGSNLALGDIRYDTWSAGLTWYLNRNIKLLAWYSHPLSEKTMLGGYTKDLADDVFTLRTQLRF